MPFDDLEYDGLCERCEKHPGMVETCTGEIICTGCDENDQQAAWERQQEQDFADFHGGVAPQSTYDHTYGRRR